MIAYFDIETNGLYQDVTQGHCMVIKIDDEVLKFRRHEGVHQGALKLLEVLQQGGFICGHNIIDYDIPTLEKLFPDVIFDRKYRGQIIDTLVLARLIYSNIKDKDFGLMKAGKIPGDLVGSHKLEAWGYRLGVFKGAYGKQENAWAEFSEEMLDYNVQDVIVTEQLHKLLESTTYPKGAIELELQAQWLMSKQERNGFPFDVFKAQELEEVLRKRSAILDALIRKEVPPIPGKVFVPKRDNKRLGYKAGVPIQRYKDFNPNSRQQLEWVITKHFDYKPDNDELYEDTRLKIDDITFSFIKSDKKAPEALRLLAVPMEEYLMVSKRLGQVSDGKMAWLKMVQADGRIHGRVNPCGAVTGRATHSYPNVAQVPAVGSPYGKECRSLFKVPDGWYQAGVDASGLELRCLAHFMAPYDNGAYAHEILNGDIHTANQIAAGLPERNQAKTFILIA